MADIKRVKLPNGDIHYFMDEYARSLRLDLLRGTEGNDILPFMWKDGKGVIPYNISILKSEWNRPICAIITNPFKNIRNANGWWSDGQDVVFKNTNQVTIPANGSGTLYFDIPLPPFYDGTVFFQNFYGWPGDRYYFDNDCEYKLDNVRMWGNNNLDFSISCSHDFGHVIAINNSSSPITVNVDDISLKCTITITTNFNRENNWFEYISGDTCIFNMGTMEFWNSFSHEGGSDDSELYLNVYFEGYERGVAQKISLYSSTTGDPNDWDLVGTINSDTAQIHWTSGNTLYYYKIKCSIIDGNNEEFTKEYLCSYVGNATISNT